MDCFQIKVNSLPLKSIAKRNVLLQKIYYSYCRLVLKKYRTNLKGVANSVLENFAGVDRSAGYLEHKTYSLTDVIRVGPSKIWISFRNDMVIGDIEEIDETKFAFVLNKLKQIARKSGIPQLWFHVSPATKLHHLLKQHVKPIPSFAVLFQDFGSPIPIEKIKFTFADIDIF
jgi:hypothetical protein